VEINPNTVKKADLAVCMPCFGKAETMAHAMRAASESLSRYFSEKAGVIIVMGIGTAEDLDLFRETPTDVPKLYIRAEADTLHQKNGFRRMFRKICDWGAKAAVMINPDRRMVVPDRVFSLGAPLFESFDYVSPLYLRHKWEGLLNNNLAYPMIRSLYGRRVRNAISGEFGFSGRLASLAGNGGDDRGVISLLGIDLWMTTLALSNNLSVCQSFVRRPFPHSFQHNGLGSHHLFREIVRTLFDLMIRCESFWLKIKWSKPTAVRPNKDVREPVLLPNGPQVALKELYLEFEQGCRRNLSLLKSVFSTSVYEQLTAALSENQEEFGISTELWAKILFDTAVAYRDAKELRRSLVDFLLHAYQGRIHSYLKETRIMTAAQAEMYVENECAIFEKTKTHLIKRWKGE